MPLPLCWSPPSESISPAVSRTIVISAIGVGLIEEGAIFGVVVLATRRSRQLNEPVDGMVYASTVALGFAAIETFLYILRAFDIGVAYHLTPADVASIALTQVAPERAILGNLGHMAWSGIIGYAYARRRLKLGGGSSSFAPTWLLRYCTPSTTVRLFRRTCRRWLIRPWRSAWWCTCTCSDIRLRHRRSDANNFVRPRYLRRCATPPQRQQRMPGLEGPHILAPPSPPPMFVPDAVIPAGGLPVWAHPDASSRLIGRLEPGTGVQTLDRLGAWADV